MMITDKFSIREQNETLVLNTIIHHPAISRAAISQVTGLNKASTSEIVKKLLDDSLVLETGAGNSTSSGGRKPILLELNKEAGCSLSIDLGYDYITSILTNLNGELIAEYKETGRTINKETVVERIKEIVTKFEHHYSKRTFELIGITIAVHGIVHDNQILFTPYSNLDDIDLTKELEELLHVPVFLENEANLSALGEKAFTTMKQNIVSISIHSGIGAGILINGELYHGNRGQGGEIGHMIIQPFGIKCPCGNEGCMEQYCSELAVLESYRYQTNNPELGLKDLAAGYLNGEKLEVELIIKTASYLAVGLNNLIVHFDPELVILNATLFEELPFLLTLIQEKMVSEFAKSVPLELSNIGKEATLLGGTVVNLQAFFHIPNLNFLQLNKH